MFHKGVGQMDERMDRIYNIIQDICTIYSNRSMGQEELAEFINDKYGSIFTASDIGEVTRQSGYWHTIKRNTMEIVIIRLSQMWRNHAEP